MHLRKAVVSLIFLTLAIGTVFAQPALKLPRVSQKSSVMQTIGLTDMTIIYSRPGVKGRAVFGDLVPWGKVWRTGADEATTINFTDDVSINGQKLAAGTYSLHTIPDKDQWTLIFNKVGDQWGSFSYDQSKDALRVTSKPEAAAFTEWLTFDVPKLSTDSATVELRWDKTSVSFTVTTDTTAKALANVRAAVAQAKPDDWRTPLRAAAFAYDNKVAAEDGAKWLDQSLKINENTGNLYLKARMRASEGHRDEAIKTAEKAVSKATDKDKELASEIQKSIERWKSGK